MAARKNFDDTTVASHTGSVSDAYHLQPRRFLALVSPARPSTQDSQIQSNRRRDRTTGGVMSFPRRTFPMLSVGGAQLRFPSCRVLPGRFPDLRPWLRKRQSRNRRLRGCRERHWWDLGRRRQRKWWHVGNRGWLGWTRRVRRYPGQWRGWRWNGNRRDGLGRLGCGGRGWRGWRNGRDRSGQLCQPAVLRRLPIRGRFAAPE